MAEIFTLSGPSSYELGAPPPAVDIACAQKVKTTLVIGGISSIAGVGTGLFGAYKLLKGRGATGIVSLLGAGFLLFAGNRLVLAAARGFESCRKI